jgi:hypothetical protein
MVRRGDRVPGRRFGLDFVMVLIIFPRDFVKRAGYM